MVRDRFVGAWPAWRAGIAVALGFLLGVGAVARADSASPDSAGPRLTAPRRWEVADVRMAHASRWRMLDAYGVQVPRASLFDPYHQNVLKGDYGWFGHDVFPVITAVGNSNAISTSRAGAQTDFKNKAVLAAELFHGATVFKPKDWSLKASGQKVANRGNQDLDDLALLEAFAEIKLFDIGPNFDFAAVRGGSQAFNSDFNGFVFKDINVGGQLFGELSQNRHRWALAYFDQRVKSKGGGITRERLDQTVLVANWVCEDFLRPGFNAVFSFQANRDHSSSANAVDVNYVGFASAGHWGRIELNPAFYYAFGTEERNRIANRETTVGAYLAGAQFAYSKGYLKYRLASFMASGDNEPLDDRATGFDSINDNINLFGGANSFLVGNAAFFTRPNSFLPSNRGGGVANFVNPGILLMNAGFDAVITPKLLLQVDYNNARFVDTGSLGLLPGGVEIARPIAHEVTGAINYRVFLNENVVIQLGGNLLIPQDGGKQILGSGDAIKTGNLGIVLVY